MQNLDPFYYEDEIESISAVVLLALDLELLPYNQWIHIHSPEKNKTTDENPIQSYLKRLNVPNIQIRFEFASHRDQWEGLFNLRHVIESMQKVVQKKIGFKVREFNIDEEDCMRIAYSTIVSISSIEELIVFVKQVKKQIWCETIDTLIVKAVNKFHPLQTE